MSDCPFFGKFQIKAIPNFPGEALPGRWHASGAVLGI
jgi:hypothetical protein